MYIYILGVVCGSCCYCYALPANVASACSVWVALCWQIQEHKQHRQNRSKTIKEIKPHYIVDIGFMRVFVGLLGLLHLLDKIRVFLGLFGVDGIKYRQRDFKAK